MKNKAKRSLYLLLVAVGFLSVSILIPALQQSKFKEWLEGAGFGLMVAATISIITLVIDAANTAKTND